MRKRMLDPHIWTNRHFLRMSDLQKLLFISLISHADDHGRLWNDTLSLKVMTFPGRNVRNSYITEALSFFKSANLVNYDETSIQLLGWKQYQSVPKPQQSRIPEPEQYRTDTELIPERLSNDPELIPPKERKKQRKKERKDYLPSTEEGKEQDQKSNSSINGNEFEADQIMKNVFDLFEEHKFKLSHAQYNEVNSLIVDKKHLSAQAKLFQYLNLTEE